MGCCSSQPPLPPEEPTIELKRKLEQLRSLWSPGSIWTGTIKIKGKETPWEIHVKRDSKPSNIVAKRVVNFATATYMDATKVEFDHYWEEIQDQKGKHLEFKEIITFSWEDDEYRLYADSMDGILDVNDRRIRGLVVHIASGNAGNVDFTRVMCVKKYGDDAYIHTVSHEWQENDPRTNRINNAFECANNTIDQEKRRLTGMMQKPPLPTEENEKTRKRIGED